MTFLIIFKENLNINPSPYCLSKSKEGKGGWEIIKRTLEAYQGFTFGPGNAPRAWRIHFNSTYHQNNTIQTCSSGKIQVR